MDKIQTLADLVIVPENEGHLVGLEGLKVLKVHLRGKWLE